MILSVTFSKPVKNISEILGGDYTRVKIKLLTASLAASRNENYFAEFYTQKQVFHKKMSEPDLKEFIALHACDTATDYALDYAIRRKAKAILSVPCCQHEINAQLSAKSLPESSALAPLLKHGLIKERFSALATDAIRAEILEQKGYGVQLLEFIEESATPKNLLIRAVLSGKEKKDFKSPLLATLQVNQTLATLICSKTLPSES